MPAFYEGRLRNRLRWWFGSSVTFIAICPIISAMIGLNLHARDLSFVPAPEPTPYVGRQVLMDIVLISMDPMEKTMTLDWTFVGEETSPCSAANLTGCTDINIFFDDNLLSAGSDKIKNSNRPTVPIFIHNASAFAITDIVANTPTFRTDLAIFSPADRSSSLIYYPFDKYSAEIFIFAQDASTNNTIGIKVARTRGIADGFKTHAYTRRGVTIPPGMLDIVIDIDRGNLVKVFSIVVVISIWLIALILLLVALICAFFGFGLRAEILGIPVATLFAFTQLRGIMPGAPEGFGNILDFVGLLPCLALLSLSGFVVHGISNARAEGLESTLSTTFSIDAGQRIQQ